MVSFRIYIFIPLPLVSSSFLFNSSEPQNVGLTA
jgi:hypothetical protein